MAGRGRRLGGYGETKMPLRRPGEAVVSTLQSADINIQTLIRQINDLLPSNVDPILLHEIETLFKQLCVTVESLKDVLLNLHCKALTDAFFGEKMVLALEQVMSLEIDSTCVRSEFLTFIESDFKMKDTMCQSDSKKFINAVMLLGSVYNFVKIQGVPIMVLGLALLEYMELLLQGDEEQLKVLTTQIVLNGNKLLTAENLAPKYELMKHSLRGTLIQRNLTVKSKCWILLALDFMSNNLKPLTGVIRDFYLDNMGDEYVYLESLISVPDAVSPVLSLSPKPFPSNDFTNFHTSPPKKSPLKNDTMNKNSDSLIQKIENMNVEVRRANQRPPLNKGSKNASKLNDHSVQSHNKIHDTRRKAKKSESNAESNSNSTQGNLFPDINDDDFYGIQIDKDKVVDPDNSKKKT